MHGYKHPSVHFWFVTNVYFIYVVLFLIVTLTDFIPIIALLCIDINIIAYTICMLLKFTLTYLYFLE